MVKRATEDVLGTLHEAIANDLLNKIISGKATPAEINAAIKFLQNNGIEAVRGTGESPLDKLAASLPTFSDEEHEGYTQ